MANRPKWDVVTPVENQDKTRWMTIGVAWEGKKPGTVAIKLNAHPLGDKLYLFVKKYDDSPGSSPPPECKEPDDPDFPF